jgi:predicted Holliday junction resolvase-like endonuclease
LILIRSKESLYKKGQYLKNKYEKKLMQMQVQLDQASQHLVERDKEIKLYRMKLKEMMQGGGGHGSTTTAAVL